MMKVKYVILAFALLFLYSLPYSNAGTEQKVLSHAENLVDGMYLVARHAEIQKQVQPIAEGERLLVNDGHLIEPSERGPVEYVVVDTHAFVPFKFTASPKEDHESGTGKPRLLLELAPEQASNLEQLTGNNVGRTVALVVDGQIVTCHKVRQAIKGGKLQITRCTKQSCELIYSHLLKNDRI